MTKNERENFLAWLTKHKYKGFMPYTKNPIFATYKQWLANENAKRDKRLGIERTVMPIVFVAAEKEKSN